jgi:LacI family transcriptional regulator
LLSRQGLELVIVEGGRHYAANPAIALRRLTATHPQAAWVLFAGTFAMQRWFAESRLPAVLLGSAFPGVELPSIEYDHAGIARHAAGRFSAAGHERTAILLRRTGSAADATTCAAFAAGRRAGSPPPLVLEHDGGLREVERQLRRLAGMRNRPTALFVTKTLAVPAVYTVLSGLGLMIPRDLSIICREDDPFLEYLSPPVARYGTDSAAIARQLTVRLVQLASGDSLRPSHSLLVPRFIPGASIAPPATCP